MNNQLSKPKKPRTCKVCKCKYESARFEQLCCTPKCAIQYAKSQREKREARERVEERKKLKAKIQALKPKSHWQRLAQAAANAFIRARDEKLPCISCGRFHNGQWHAGHYLSRGAHPELALEPRNIHKQCAPCNNHLSGNQVNFRKGLIERFGAGEVEWLEGRHEPKHYSIDDLKEIAAKYRAMTKQLHKANGAR